MSRYIYMLTLALVLGLSTSAFGQDKPTDDNATEEAANPGKPDLASTTDKEAGGDDDSAAGDDDDSAAIKPFVPGQDPETIEEGVGFLVKAIESKSWPVAIGLILTIIVMLMNSIGLKDKVGKKAVPWVVMALATATTIGGALAIGTEVGPAIMQGVLTGGMSITVWELMAKHVFRKDKKDEPTPEAPKPEPAKP